MSFEKLFLTFSYSSHVNFYCSRLRALRNVQVRFIASSKDRLYFVEDLRKDMFYH